MPRIPWDAQSFDRKNLSNCADKQDYQSQTRFSCEAVDRHAAYKLWCREFHFHLLFESFRCRTTTVLDSRYLVKCINTFKDRPTKHILWQAWSYTVQTRLELSKCLNRDWNSHACCKNVSMKGYQSRWYRVSLKKFYLMKHALHFGVSTKINFCPPGTDLNVKETPLTKTNRWKGFPNYMFDPTRVLRKKKHKRRYQQMWERLL